jgi:hypothetical protein
MESEMVESNMIKDNWIWTLPCLKPFPGPCDFQSKSLSVSTMHSLSHPPLTPHSAGFPCLPLQSLPLPLLACHLTHGLLSPTSGRLGIHQVLCSCPLLSTPWCPVPYLAHFALQPPSNLPNCPRLSSFLAPKLHGAGTTLYCVTCQHCDWHEVALKSGPDDRGWWGQCLPC